MVTTWLLLVLVASCRAQYQMETDLRADLTFNAGNDRFDVGNIIRAQKQQFHDQPAQVEESWRRSFQPLAEVLKQNRRRYQQAHKSRRMDPDFAYHDAMLDSPDDGMFEQNLDPFKIKTTKPSRRHNPRKKTKKAHKKGRSKRRSKKSHTSKSENSLRNSVHLKDKPTIKEDIKGLQDVVLNYLHGGKVISGRRSNTNLEDEVLLHYAVPLKMKIKGFLELP